MSLPILGTLVPMLPPILRPLTFMRMPTEIRDRIFGMLFNETVLNIIDGRIDVANSVGPLDICLVNRTIYNASILELYRSAELVYVQVLRNVGPADLQLAPQYRSLIRSLELRRSCHWTQFRVNWQLLRSFGNLEVLKIVDDSLFIWSVAEDDDELHTGVTDLHTVDGPVDDLLMQIMGHSLHDAQAQPLPIVRGPSFTALCNRIRANPPRRFRIEYWKTGMMIDNTGGHLLVVNLAHSRHRLVANTVIDYGIRCGHEQDY
jgi:hypothetical protein